MKKRYIILTPLLVTLSLHAPPPPPPPPSGYQTMHVSTQPKMLVPPQLEQQPSSMRQAMPHPAPSATPGALNAFLADKQIPNGPKIRALHGPRSGLALSGQTYKIRPGENNKVPAGAHAMSNGAMLSCTQQHRTPITTGQLFNDPELGRAYQNFIDAVHEVPTFIPMFRNLHIVALHQIYTHLVGIYITLNMTYITDIKSYLALEKRFGLNKKTLIINQLVKVIQSQLTQALLTLLPGVPLSYSIQSGMRTIHRDTLSNPDALVLDLETAVLTAIGASPVSNNDAIQLYSTLTSPEAQELIRRNKEINIRDLEQGLKIIYQGAGFVKPLVKNRPVAQAVVAAINTIVGEHAQNTSESNYQQIIKTIESGSTEGMTKQQMNIFKETIKQLVYGVPLSQQVSIAEQLGKMINSNNEESLSPEVLNAFNGVLGFVLQSYEQRTSTMLEAIVKKLGVLNPEMQTLTPMEQIQLKNLAVKLTGKQGKQSLQFDEMTPSEREVISLGFIMVGSSTSNAFSRLEKNILVGVGHELEQGPISLADLNSIQTRSIEKALNVFTTYTFKPLNKEEMLSQFSQEELDELSRLCGDINSSQFKNFEQFSKRQQQLLLRMYQGLVTVVQTRLYEHQQASEGLRTIFSSNPLLQQALFQGISSNQYLALNTVDKILQENGNRFSFNMLPEETPRAQPGDTQSNPPISPKQALSELFTINKKSNNASFLTLLLTLQKQNNTNPSLQNIMGRMPSNEEQEYQAIGQALSNPKFNFSDLNIVQKRLLVRDFQELKQSATAQSITEEGRTSLLAGTPAAHLQTMGTLIENTMNFTKTKTSFLWVLKQYLIFFNLYCSTLQQYESNGYVGLTKFEEYARNITEKLRGTEMEKLNPPIFFYNKETLGGIRMLPQLARIIENTEVVPFPTFPMILALEGSTIDPLDGKTYNNEVNYGNFSFNKFFFIDTQQPNNVQPNEDPQAYQPAQELTGKAAQSIQWIKKLNIPASTKTTTYRVEDAQGQQQDVKVKSYNFAFFPDNVPPGISGFYANIPIFAKNPVDPRRALIRLYEQPIYAQPPWLNSPGFSNKKPDNIPGVVTVLRGCLGDFSSILNLDIFDPCISVIFASALALPDRETSFNDIQSNPQIKQAMGKCSIYLKAKRAELQRMSQTHQINASTVSGQTNIGGTGPLPLSQRLNAQLLPQNITTDTPGGGVVL